MRVERSGKPTSAERALPRVCCAHLDGSFRPAFLLVVYKFAIPFDFAPANRRSPRNLECPAQRRSRARGGLTRVAGTQELFTCTSSAAVITSLLDRDSRASSE